MSPIDMAQIKQTRKLRGLAQIDRVRGFAERALRVGKPTTQRQRRRCAPALLLLHVRLGIHDSFLRCLFGDALNGF